MGADPGATRAAILTAAANAFSQRGFDGVVMEDIGRAADVNKAMIYYHFSSKAGLYGEILRDMFGAVAMRLAGVTAHAADPTGRIRALVEAIAREAEARPHFPSIWLREIADGGSHVDKGTMALIAGILQQVASAVRKGVATKRFVAVDPLLVQLGIVGPLLMFFAGAPIRRKAASQLKDAVPITTDQVIAHVQRVALLTLEGDARPVGAFQGKHR